MLDLKTQYLGLTLEHPVVVSASPLSKTVDGVLKLEEHGAAAVVLPSLFEEQVDHEHKALELQAAASEHTSPEAQSYFVEQEHYSGIADHYLRLVEQASARSSIPVIASINGTSQFGWVDIAEQIQAAGAKAIELNIHCVPTDFTLTAQDIEDNAVATLEAVRRKVSIPIALKISPYYSALGNLAKRFEAAGADGLVMFNRFYQPDFDIEKREATRTLVLSDEKDIQLPLHWIGLLRDELELSLAATSGVSHPRDVLKYLMAGADVVMTASALLRHGPEFLSVLVSGLKGWMAQHGYASVAELRGSMSWRKVGSPQVYERAQYMTLLSEYELP